MVSGGDKDKAATSLPEAALPTPTLNSVPVQAELALIQVVVLEAVLRMVELMAAGSLSLVLVTIATTVAPKTMLDFPLLNHTEEDKTASASLVPLLPLRVPDPKLLTASSTAVLVLEAILNLLSSWVVSL
jgi:hypothetical protein